MAIAVVKVDGAHTLRPGSSDWVEGALIKPNSGSLCLPDIEDTCVFDVLLDSP